MPPRGKLIALEGIDGSGKGTQLDLLASALEARKLPIYRISFPRYESFYGKLVGRYLNGEFGALTAVDPHLSALLYAGDRLEAKPDIEAALASGKIVLADRYIGSNMAHQSARVSPENRDDFFAWLKHLEYVLYGLPAEDLVIYLRVPFEQAHRLVGLKSARNYTKLTRDIHEADVGHLEQTGIIYDRLATEANWVRVDCTEEESKKLRPPEAIHRAVMECVGAQLLSRK
jgi:dTMP kinase